VYSSAGVAAMSFVDWGVADITETVKVLFILLVSLTAKWKLTCCGRKVLRKRYALLPIYNYVLFVRLVCGALWIVGDGLNSETVTQATFQWWLVHAGPQCVYNTSSLVEIVFAIGYDGGWRHMCRSAVVWLVAASGCIIAAYLQAHVQSHALMDGS